MGKNQHSKDGLHLRPTEWAEDGRGFKARKQSPYAKLPLHCCALSLQPFETPVATRDGEVFEARNIIAYIKRFGVNPVSGGKLETKELTPVHFHKNEEGKFHCPVTFKVFTHHSHVALNIASGHVYSWDTVEQLNRKVKNFTDLITSQKFEWEQIIRIQDPDNPEQREISKFYFMREGQQQEVIEEITHRASKVTREAKKDTIRKDGALERIFDEKKQIAEEKAKADAEKASEEPARKALPAPEVRGEHERYTSGAMAESFTSSIRSVKFTNELRQKTEGESLVDIYEGVRKKKLKGYVRIITSAGMLNLELHADFVPRTVDNFLRLCERGYYDNTIYHRLIHNFMIQGGDPTGTGRGGESGFDGGDEFKDEFDSRLHHQGPGVVSMANSGKNTNKSQFFVSLKSCPHLDNKHSIFGRVVGGLQLLEAFNAWGTDEKDRPRKEIKLLKTEVFKNPFKEVRAEHNRPKVEKVVDPIATWFSNRKDPMEEHPNRQSSTVGKYLDQGPVAQPLTFDALTAARVKKRRKDAAELPAEELEYANVATKKKKMRTDFDFSKW